MTSQKEPDRIVVCHLITELSTGGAQVALYRLLAGMDRERYAPIVVCLYNGDAAIAENIRTLGIPVIDLGMRSKWRWDAFWRLYPLLREKRPTILHTWLFHANISGRVVGRMAGAPIIITSERTMGMEGCARLWLNRLTGPLADRITCVSQQVGRFAEQVIHLPQEKVVVIPNGIPMDEFANFPQTSLARADLALPAEAVLIGSIGRMHAVKGFDILLDAFSRIAFTYHNTHLLMVGGGPELRGLQVKASQLGLEKRVTFLGQRSDIVTSLASMDIFVLPSLHEGMPNAVMEAMAAGLCVIATSVGGVPEVVLHNQTGLITPPGDAQALGDAMAVLLNEPQLRAQMGQQGREHILKNYSIESTIAKTQNLYETLLATRRADP